MAGARIALRALALAGLAVIGFAAVQAQFDHVTRDRPALAAWIWEPFRAETHAVLAERALESRRAEAALRASSALVARSPVPAENLSLLMQAALAAGQPDLALAAGRAAAGRGWRDPWIQLVVIDSALHARDWQVAAQRIDALQRLGAEAAVLVPPTSLLAQSREGRKALAAQLDASGGWRHRFLTEPRWSSVPGHATLVGELIRRAPQHADCADLALAVTQAVARSDAHGVDAMWIGPCAAAGHDGRHVNGFQTPDADADDGAGQGDPFAWRYPPEAGLQRTFDAAPGAAGTLGHANHDPFVHTLAQRNMRLGPGRYRLLTAGAGDVRLRIACLPGNGALVDGAAVSEIAEFAIPVKDCPFQQLILLAGPNSTSDAFSFGIAAVPPRVGD